MEEERRRRGEVRKRRSRAVEEREVGGKPLSDLSFLMSFLVSIWTSILISIDPDVVPDIEHTPRARRSMMGEPGEYRRRLYGGSEVTPDQQPTSKRFLPAVHGAADALCTGGDTTHEHQELFQLFQLSCYN
jgi:hypothetical protein